jgi:hypothetical protein
VEEIIFQVLLKARKVLTNSAVMCCSVWNLLKDGGKMKFYTEPPANTRPSKAQTPPSHELPQYFKDETLAAFAASF